MSRYESYSGGASRTFAPYPSSGGGRGGGHDRRTHHRGGYRGGRRDHYRNGGGSYHGGKGNTGAADYRENDTETHRANKLRSTLLGLGEKAEFHAPSELYAVAQDLVDQASSSAQLREVIERTFLIMITEQPQKMPLTAALLATLVLAPPTPKDQPTDAKESSSLGSVVVNELLQAFRSYLDARLWRNVRLTLRFFCLLTPLRIISASSLYKLFDSLAAVMDEPAVTLARADRAATCILEPLCYTGDQLLAADPGAKEQLDKLVDALQSYGASRRVADDLLLPWQRHASLQPLSTESFETLLQALQNHKSLGYPKIPFLPQPGELVPPAISADLNADVASTVDVPETLIPPDEEDYVSLGQDLALAKLNQAAGPQPLGVTSKARAKILSADEAQIKRGGTGPQGRFIYARWMTESTPLTDSPSSVVLRSLVNDLIDLYEPNRRTAAKVLLDLPKFLHKGTFGGKMDPNVGLVGDTAMDWSSAPRLLAPASGSWILEDLLVEGILSNALLLPAAPHPELYYAALMREVVAASPQTIAPAIGKSLRRIYTAMATGKVETEVTKRLSDWFSAHLSNFNFGWAWKEWVPDMELPPQHPRRAFCVRVADLCVRLAYYDRVKSVLPAELQTGALPQEEPGPSFTYEDPNQTWHVKATELVNSFRAKASADVVLANLESFKREIIAPDDVTMTDTDAPTVATEAQAEIMIRDVAVQAVLSVGSRSFSHFLNVVERYHALLRNLSTSPEMRIHILGAVARFWRRSPQWILIVADKLLQYRILEPSDIVKYVFDPAASKLPVDGLGQNEEARDWSSFVWWDLLRNTIEKINGRVNQLQARVEALEAEEAARQEMAEAEAAAAPSKKANEEEEAPAIVFPTSVAVPVPEDPAKEKKDTLQDRRVALEAVMTEQRKVLSALINGFAEAMPANPTDAVDEPDWNQYWLTGWSKELLRRFHTQFGQNQQTLTAAFPKAIPAEFRRLFDQSCVLDSE